MIAYGLWCYMTQSPRSFELLQGPEVEALVYLYSSSRNPSRPLPHFVCTMAQRLGASAKARARANNGQDRGWAPLRADAPGRLPRRRGSFPDLDTAEARASAVEDLRKDVYAASSIPGVTSRIRFLRKALRRWKQSPWPITVEKVERVGAALKRGNYASADAYLSQYRVSSERRGYDITGPLARAFKDADRACKRGIGAGVKSMGFPFDRLKELPGTHRPWVANGPVSPRYAMVVGAWFLAREVELSTARACLVSVTEGACPAVSWCLPATKADLKAE